MPCRINKRRMWTYRQVFEGLCHEENSFVTLTYTDEKLPSDGSVDPRELQLFLKRLRFNLGDRKIRFFGCGEYGERTGRPHYHLTVFGAGQFTQVAAKKLFPTLVEETWGKGHILVGDFNDKTASYLAGYVTKKMTNKSDVRLDGRHPEFARMSNRPGIGAEAMMTIAKQLCASGHGMALLERGDIPHELQIGGKKVPLGRYLLHKLREAVGFTPDYIKQVKDTISHERSFEMLALFQAAIVNAEVLTIKEAHALEVAGKVAAIEGRAKVYGQMRSL